jgi:hypothetical protein
MLAWERKDYAITTFDFIDVTHRCDEWSDAQSVLAVFVKA